MFNKKQFCVLSILTMIFLLLPCCKDQNRNENKSETIKIGTCADYPPFEFYSDGVIIGFEIEIGKLICEKLGKKAVFEDMPFNSILAALQNGTVDIAISAFDATPEREKNFDFSTPYYKGTFAFVYKKGNSVKTRKQASGKKITCQLGSFPERWIKKSIPDAEVISMDNIGTAIESLKAGHTDCIFQDTIVAKNFCKENPELEYSVVLEAANDYDCGSGMALVIPKGSYIKKEKINEILSEPESVKKVQELKKEWDLLD
ncbi:MAG: ABC transporter substrate-binding protein [Holosporales bacterium]|jgi:polar amino acid transport system substrate-binding protein|nr:ABC transporter substrate-binding protein [Holosporales bacterium]